MNGYARRQDADADAALSRLPTASLSGGAGSRPFRRLEAGGREIRDPSKLRPAEGHRVGPVDERRLGELGRLVRSLEQRPDGAHQPVAIAPVAMALALQPPSDVEACRSPPGPATAKRFARLFESPHGRQRARLSQQRVRPPWNQAKRGFRGFERFLVAMQKKQRAVLVDPCLDEVGIARVKGLECLEGFPVPAEPHSHRAGIEARLRMAGIRGKRSLVALQRLLDRTAALEHERQVEIELRVVGKTLERIPQRLFRRLPGASLSEDGRERADGVWRTRRNLQGLPQRLDGAIAVAERMPGDAEKVPRTSAARGLRGLQEQLLGGEVLSIPEKRKARV